MIDVRWERVEPTIEAVDEWIDERSKHVIE